MLRYAVVEISGKQYKVAPEDTIKVDYLGVGGKLSCDKVLLIKEDNSLKIGKPYLKESLSFKILEEVRGDKIRIATYHAKANTRRVKGARPTYTSIKLEANSVKK